jgi:hypothetical protein
MTIEDYARWRSIASVAMAPDGNWVTRMEQFYDHYLFGQPAPDWMVNGVPFLNKKRAARDLTTRPPATSTSTQASGARGR